ncbi:tachykinin-like peptides receptor 86C [Dermacentor andersoni]|uniref:tachykinin-like peptides receptor 86C n=1 Tax=Dermacentor andersoni TaxID=34620 RepID=UPI003B3B7433
MKTPSAQSTLQVLDDLGPVLLAVGYFAVVRPLWARLPRWLALAAVCGVWTASALLSLPNLLYSRTRSYRYADGSVRTVCLLMWPDGPAYMSHTDYVYNVLFLVLTYVVPVITMVVTYTGMGVVLWGSRGIGESTERQQNVLQAKRKVVRMLIAVVTLFSVSWLPYNAYFVYVSHNPHVAYLDHIQHVYLAMYWLAMSHAMCNPIVYYCMNKRNRCVRSCLSTTPSFMLTLFRSPSIVLTLLFESPRYESLVDLYTIFRIIAACTTFIEQFALSSPFM